MENEVATEASRADGARACGPSRRAAGAILFSAYGHVARRGHLTLRQLSGEGRVAEGDLIGGLHLREGGGRDEDDVAEAVREVLAVVPFVRGTVVAEGDGVYVIAPGAVHVTQNLAPYFVGAAHEVGHLDGDDQREGCGEEGDGTSEEVHREEDRE